MTQPFTVNFTQARFVGERVCSGVHERSGVSGIMVEVVEDKHSRKYGTLDAVRSGQTR